MTKSDIEKKYNWKSVDIIDSTLTEEEIKEIVNKKIAHIIIELELNSLQTSIDKRHCENEIATVVNDTIRMYKKGKIKMYKIVHEIS